MGEKLTGGCACGAVRYECGELPIVQLICHCRDCQRASGSAFAGVIFVPSDGLAFTGSEPRYHEVTTATGRKLQRGFCRECGSPVTGRWPGNALFQILQASGLDDPAIFAPSVEVWMSRAHAWHSLHPATEKFDQGPPVELMRGQIEAYFAGRKQTPG